VPIPPFLEGRIGDVPSSSPGRGGLPSPLHILTASCSPWSSLLHSFARGERPPDRRRGGSSAREGGHRRGSTAPSTTQLRQQHFSGAEEEWEDAPSHQPQEAKCSPFRDPSFQDGDPRTCVKPSILGTGRPPSIYGGQEVPPVWLERTPVPILRSPLQPVTRWIP
jgi:hypothetical protein